MTYPRPVREVHQIEITSRCNLRCVYCPSRDLDKPVEDDKGKLLELAVNGGSGGFGRPMVDMDLATFHKALRHVAHLVVEGTQGELALTGIGEATIHPDFVEMLKLARATIGPDRPLTFSTNGIELSDDLCARIAQYRPDIYISLHRPERAKQAVDNARKYNLLAAVNVSAATEAFDWAGALDWPVSIERGSVTCEFLRSGWCVVLADGRITTCCLDAEGSGIIGHVDDKPGGLAVQPWEGKRQGCESCHMEVPA